MSNTKPVSQLYATGYFASITLADESPLEPGVWLMPALTVDAIPPGTYTPSTDPGLVGTFEPDWPADKWPRWNGSAFLLVSKPQAEAEAESSPAEKLAAFLSANPDVAALVNSQG